MRGCSSLLLSFHLMQLNFTAMVSVPGGLNVMCGDPWCHPAQLLKCSMLSCVSLDISSSIFPLTENLAMCSPPPPLPCISRPSLFFFWCYFGSICTVFYDYFILVIVAEMTNFWIVLQVFINIVRFFFFFFPTEFCAIVSLNCCLQVKSFVSTLQGGNVLFV